MVSAQGWRNPQTNNGTLMSWMRSPFFVGRVVSGALSARAHCNAGSTSLPQWLGSVRMALKLAACSLDGRMLLIFSIRAGSGQGVGAGMG